MLLTRDEYIAFRVRQKKQDRKERLPLLTFAGAVGFLAGAAGLFFGDLIQMTAGTSLCLLLLGLFCFVYDGMIAPLLDGVPLPKNMMARKNCAWPPPLFLRETGEGG